jgi:hypothetical protein
MKYFTLLPLRALLLLLIAVLACIRTSTAQTPTVQDCLGAIPVCQETYTQATTYLGAGAYPNEIYNPAGSCENDCPGSCLDGEQNSVWYVFTVQTSGQLRLIIDPFFDEDDYDWAVYDISLLRCTDIYTKYQQMQKSCNAFGSQTFNGPTGISTANGGTANCNHCGESGTSRWNADLPVTAGNTYVLIIENWGTTPQGGYNLDFSASTAIIYDNIRPYLDIVHGEDISCGDAQVLIEFSENVTCESVDPSDFVLSGPGGPYTVLDVQGEVCMLGGEMERVYTLLLDRPISEDGDYSLQLIPISFVYDACNNFALGNTVVFSVSLGAPVIVENSLQITAATCGLSNGSITGLMVTGTAPFTYTWRDDLGNVVGNTLNLVNVPSGNYFLEVDDPNTCQATAGPYFVDQTGAPQVDASAIVITGANWQANNGHITGIQVTGTEPLTYQWTDELSNVVGDAIDLHDMYTGNYFLLVTDAYGCDTLAGAYFIPQIGGPLGVTATAYPSEICFGGSSNLTATGTGGTTNYTYLWTSTPSGFTSTLQTPTVFPETTTVYTVTIDDGFNFSQSMVPVTVNQLPIPNAGTDVTIPFGTSVTIYGNASGGSGNYSYSWEPAAQLINPDAQNPATRNLFATTFFKLTVTDEDTHCVSLKDTVKVNLSGGPLGMALEAQKDSICRGETTVLQAAGFGGNEPYYTFTWYFNDLEVKVEDGANSTLQVSGLLAGPLTYEVDIWDGFNHFPASVTVEVMESPSFTISGGPNIVACPYDSVLLAPSQTYPNCSYYWSNGATTRTIKVGTTGIGFDLRSYSLQVTTLQGCQFTDSATVVFDFAACFGIDEYESFSTVKVFPNPTQGAFTVDFEEGQGFSELIVLNSLGDAILQLDLNDLPNGPAQMTVDLTRLPSGIYFLQAVNERFIYHQKVIKK